MPEPDGAPLGAPAADRLEVAPGLWLTADGGAWVPAAGVLVVADLHVGYARAARRRGGWLPTEAESTDGLATRLRAACARVGAGRLVIAGDLRHSTRDVDDRERAEVSSLIADLRDATSASRLRLDVDIIAGNHDRGDASPTRMQFDGIDVTHLPPGAPPERWTVCGHLHPSTLLRDETGASMRVPCALVGPRTLILPAFTTWAGGTTAGRLARGMTWGEWRAVVVAGGRVWEVRR